MKIVREHINEIVRGHASAIGALGIGKAKIIEDWAKSKQYDNEIGSFTIDAGNYIHSMSINIRNKDIKNLPFPANKDSFKFVHYVNCMDCEFDKKGNLISKDRGDFVKSILYDMERDEINTKVFVNNYLYYTALKYIESFGEEGLFDSDVLNYIRPMAFPNTNPSECTYWEKVFRQDYHTPIVDGTTKIGVRLYKINDWGRNYISKHASKFEK